MPHLACTCIHPAASESTGHKDLLSIGCPIPGALRCCYASGSLPYSSAAAISIYCCFHTGPCMARPLHKPRHCHKLAMAWLYLPLLHCCCCRYTYPTCCLFVTRATKPLLMGCTVLLAPHCWQRKCISRVALSLSNRVSTDLQPGHNTYLKAQITQHRNQGSDLRSR